MKVLKALAMGLVLLISFNSSNVFAVSKWTHGYNDSGNSVFNYAKTVNPNNTEITMNCYISNSQCIFIIALNATCKEDDVYRIELETDTMVMDTEIQCLGNSNKKGIYTIQSFADFADIIKNGKYLITSISVGSGKVSVQHFRLHGAMNIIIEMINDFKLRTGNTI